MFELLRKISLTKINHYIIAIGKYNDDTFKQNDN